MKTPRVKVHTLGKCDLWMENDDGDGHMRKGVKDERAQNGGSADSDAGPGAAGMNWVTAERILNLTTSYAKMLTLLTRTRQCIKSHYR